MPQERERSGQDNRCLVFHSRPPTSWSCSWSSERARGFFFFFFFFSPSLGRRFVFFFFPSPGEPPPDPEPLDPTLSFLPRSPFSGPKPLLPSDELLYSQAFCQNQSFNHKQQQMALDIRRPGDPRDILAVLSPVDRSLRREASTRLPLRSILLGVFAGITSNLSEKTCTSQLEDCLCTYACEKVTPSLTSAMALAQKIGWGTD